MKYIFFILFSLICSISYSQFTNTTTQGSNTTLVKSRGGYTADSMLAIPAFTFADTTAANWSVVRFYSGAIIQTSGPEYWIRQLNPNKWNKFNTSAASLVSISQLYGITLTPNPITTVGTVMTDTTVIVSKPYFTNIAVKYWDTANMLLPYLRKSDTSTMLSNYLRKTDTSNMLLPYLRKTDTSNMLLPYLRKSDTASMLSNRLKISDTASMLIGKSRNRQSTIGIIDMHYDIMKGIGLTSAETPGTNSYNVATTSLAGSFIITLTANSSIENGVAVVQDQLIVYRGTDSTFYTSKIESVSGVTVTLGNPLQCDVAGGGANFFSFYVNESHPNSYGMCALADYVIRSYKTQYEVETRFNINTAFGSGIISPSVSNAINNTGSTQIACNSVVSTTALTDGVTATFNVLNTGAHVMKFVINTFNVFVRARITYDGINYDTIFKNSEPGTVNLPLWISSSSRSVTVTLASTTNGGTFILNQEVAVLKVSGIAPTLNAQRHVILGDSWIDSTSAGYYFDARLRQRLPNAYIKNAGTGGDRTVELINRFNRDVSPYNPDIVWILVGTNDYYQGVTNSQYSYNINRLKHMVDSIGAHLILYTSSVGATQFDTTRFKLSRQYANIAKIYNENITGLNASGYLEYPTAQGSENFGTYNVTAGQFILNGGTTDGIINYNASLGMTQKGRAGATYDNSIISPSGSTVFGNPTGTLDALFGGKLSASFNSRSASITEAVDSFLIATGGTGGLPAVINYRTALQVRNDIGAGTGSVISVATNNGTGITGGTFTTSGTIAADTAILSTKLNVLNQLNKFTGTTNISTLGTVSTGTWNAGSVTSSGAGIFNSVLASGTSSVSPNMQAEIKGLNGEPVNTGTAQTGILRLSQSSGNSVLDFSINGALGARINVTNSTDLSLHYPLALNQYGGNILIGTSTDNGSDKLQVSGNIASTGNYTGLHVIGNSSTPSISTSQSASVSVSGTDLSGEVTFTPSTNVGMTGDIFTLTFNVAYGATPKIVWSQSGEYPTTAAAGTLYSTASTTTFKLSTTNGATFPVGNGLANKWTYIVVQ